MFLSRFKRIFHAFLGRFGFEIRRLGASSPPPVDQVPQNLRWIRSARIQTVIDIGANTGQSALLFRRILPTARIYSFEPLPDCFEKLVHAVRGDSLVECFQVALGSSNGKITFNRNEYTPSSSMLRMAQSHKTNFPYTALEIPVEVEVVRLDDFAGHLELREPILVKVDVQGFEDNVVNGALEVFRKTSVVIIEMSLEVLYEGQVLFDDLYRKMVSLGFAYRGNFDQLHSPLDGRILQVDAIFVREL